MLTLRITQNTFFKASTQQSETLPANQKAFVNANKEFHLKSYYKKDRHYGVQLLENISPVGNSGFFFEEHIQIEEIVIDYQYLYHSLNALIWDSSRRDLFSFLVLLRGW